MVTQITPEAPEGNYAMGKEYISLSSDHIDVELGYDGMQGEDLVFDFVVHNTTSDTLTILPAVMSIFLHMTILPITYSAFP